MSATATLVAAFTVLALVLVLAMPLWLQHRVRRRIADQERTAAPMAGWDVGGSSLSPLAPARSIAGDGADGTAAPGVPDVDVPGVPLAELLDGMTLPCDLTPLTFVEPPGSDVVDRLVFVTDWAPDRLRADLKGALASVEFDLTWTTADEGVATRGTTGFRVRLHRAPDRVMVGTRPAFPTAASGSTVVELAIAY